MNTNGFTALVSALTVVCSTAFSATSVTTIDSGGARVSSASYTMDGSAGGIGGISTVASPPETVKHGYIGQLSEVISVSVTGVPAQVNEGSTSQFSGTATLDDATLLALGGSDINWSAPSFPIASINSSGLATAAAVYTNTSGAFSGNYLGVSGVGSLLVLDTNPDNYGLYANDGIPDAWQIEYFGPDNPQGVATGDPDGDGRNNLAEFLAGNDPTNSASAFRITAIAREGNNMRIEWTCVGGHSYVLQSTRDAAIASYTTNYTDASPVIAAPGVGESTTNYLDVGAAYAPVLTSPGASNQLSQSTTSTVYCSASSTRGLADSLGGAVPVGSLLMLGMFDISEATIQSNFNAGNLSAIMSAFTTYSTSFAVGDGTGLPASWDVSRSAAGFGGQKIYLLAVDKPTLPAATHLGIFTAPSWVFPEDEGEIYIGLEDATDFVIGAHGGPLTIDLGLGQTYTFDDTARLSFLPGRMLFYRVRLVP